MSTSSCSSTWRTLTSLFSCDDKCVVLIAAPTDFARVGADG